MDKSKDKVDFTMSMAQSTKAPGSPTNAAAKERSISLAVPSILALGRMASNKVKVSKPCRMVANIGANSMVVYTKVMVLSIGLMEESIQDLGSAVKWKVSVPWNGPMVAVIAAIG